MQENRTRRVIAFCIHVSLMQPDFLQYMQIYATQNVLIIDGTLKMQPVVTKYLNCCSAIYQILGKTLGNLETFDSFLFNFNYLTFLSFESMFTENVNLKCNKMSTDIIISHFFLS